MNITFLLAKVRSKSKTLCSRDVAGNQNLFDMFLLVKQLWCSKAPSLYSDPPEWDLPLWVDLPELVVVW